MAENVIIFPVNVHALQDLRVRCVMIYARLEHTVKHVNRSANVKMTVYVIRKPDPVNVHLVGLEKFVRIDARPDSMVKTVSNNANVTITPNVIIFPASVNALPDTLVQNALTHAKLIHMA